MSVTTLHLVSGESQDLQGAGTCLKSGPEQLRVQAMPSCSHNWLTPLEGSASNWGASCALRPWGARGAEPPVLCWPWPSRSLEQWETLEPRWFAVRGPGEGRLAQQIGGHQVKSVNKEA